MSPLAFVRPLDPRLRRRVSVAAGTFLLVVILLLRACLAGPAASFDWFRAKAEELDRDPAAVVAWVRDEVRTRGYRGDLRGALATLWQGSGSPEEKLALARAVLAHCQEPPPVDLDAVAPDRNAGTDAAETTAYPLNIGLRLRRGEDWRETELYNGPVGPLVGDVQSLVVTPERELHLILRGAEATTDAVPIGEADAGELRFDLRLPDREEPVTVTRELWHADNRTGPRGPLVGDRHDFVLLPCRVPEEVVSGTRRILRQQGRLPAGYDPATAEGAPAVHPIPPDAKALLALLDYAARSDRFLDDLERDHAVRARFDRPRILVISHYAVPPQVLPGGVWAFDLRANRAGFAGEPAAAYQATMTRCFIESGLEQHFLTDFTGLPCSSVFALLGELRRARPDTAARRAAAILAGLRAIADHGGVGAALTCTATHPALAADAGAPSVVVTPATDGWRVVGGPVAPGFAAAAREDPTLALPFAGDRLDAVLPDATAAAVAVETCLLAAAGTPAVPPDYLLGVEIDCGRESVVVPGAHLAFAWEEDGRRTEQDAWLEAVHPHLVYDWRVQTGTRPVTGRRRVQAPALAAAKRHNPWYKQGASQQESASSLCLSRAVFAELAAGREAGLALLGPFPAGAGPLAERPVVWEGRLVPDGTGSHRCRVNGRELELPLRWCRRGDRRLALLDDPRFPVGRADALTAIGTAVRLRLTDPAGRPVAGARLRVLRDDDAVEADAVVSWPDGRCRLPPPPDAAVWGAVDLEVALPNCEPQALPVDLDAPGLDEVAVTVPERGAELVWLTPRDRGRLGRLPISDQVKRHARRAMRAGHHLLIPDRMLAGPTGRRIGFYAFDATTGHLDGITETGICGTSDAEDRAWSEAMGDLADSLAESKGDLRGMAVLHVYRGTLVASWLYCGYRVGGSSHRETILALLAEMSAWEQKTNLFTGLDHAVPEQVAGKIKELVNSGATNTSSDAAKSAFMLGYLSATVGMAAYMEGK